jgi:hypothetical protein
MVDMTHGESFSLYENSYEAITLTKITPRGKLIPKSIQSFKQGSLVVVIDLAEV